MVVKYQVFCLLLVLYILVIYVKQTQGKTKCNLLYDLILGFAPWAIIFDGVTAITVNHRDVVPGWANIIAHGLFFLFMNLVIVFSFFYMLDMAMYLEGKRKSRLFYAIPGIISIGFVIGFLPKLEYIAGKSTDYSMGISVIAVYASLVIHYGMILFLLIFKKNRLEKSKRYSILFFVFISFGLLICQMIWPEVLITAGFPVIMVIGLYVTEEDPSRKKIKTFNEHMVMDFATLVESRDDSTGGHIKRTQMYVKIILDEMKKDPRYHWLITKDYVNYVTNAAPMHDLGKISTPDSILLKPGRLTPEEYDIMKLHAAKGGEIIDATFGDLEDEEFKKVAKEVARHHHEKWDGKGYPDGLSKGNIPLHARIMAVADVFDAVSAKRVYRDAMPLDKCFEIIENGRGTDFDPEIVDFFMQAKSKVVKYFVESEAEGK